MKVSIIIAFAISLLSISCKNNETKISHFNPPVIYLRAIDSFPKATGWVNDFDNIFTAAQKHELDSIIARHEKATTNQIALVTLDSLMTKGKKFDSLIIAVHNQWGVGQKDKNNGVVLGISLAERAVRINTGYGLEAKLTNAECSKIIYEQMTPYFKKGQYFEGIKKGLLAVINELK